MRGLFLRMLGMVRAGGVGVMGGGTVGLIQLLGAVRTFEFVTLTGDGNQGNSQEQNGGKFHRAAS